MAVKRWGASSGAKRGGPAEGLRRMIRGSSRGGMRRLKACVSCVAVFLLAVPAGRVAAQEPAPDLSHPLSVDELVRLATERNLDLAQARQGVQSARGTYTSSFSGLLPNLSAEYSYSRNAANSFEPLTYFDPNTGRLVQLGGANATTYQYSYGFNLGGRTNLIDLPSWYSHSQASHGFKAAEQGLRNSRSSIALSVRQQYYALVQAQQLATVSDEAYTLSQDQLKRAQSLYQLGSVARSDVLQAQVNMATSDRDRIGAQNTIQQERARLCLLLALPVDSPLQVEEPAPVDTLALTVPAEEQLVQQALRARPDVIQAREAVDAARMGEQSSRSQRYPSIGGSYSYSKQQLGAADVVSKFGRDYRWNFTLGASLTLFDGLATKGSIQRAQAARRTEEEALRAKNLQVALDVREAVLAIKNASEEIRSARQGVSFAEESVRLQKALYESGGGTLLEWNNAQVELTRARVAQVQAEVDLRVAQAGLSKALGEDSD